MTTQQEWAILMARMAAAFPNSKPDKLTIQVYYELLRTASADDLRHSIDACISQPGRRFPPTIGEIQEALEIYRESKPTQFKQLESHEEPVYVPMPQECKDELNAFFAKKGIKSKYRMLLENEARRLEQIK